MSQQHLTEAELRELDAADGTIDGKYHGVDIHKFTHDATKSTKEGEWEFRDGKYYRRDYYGAGVDKPDPRDAEIRELRRLLSEKDALIAELRRLLADRDMTITQLRASIQQYKLTIERYESRISILESEARQVVVAPPPPPVIVPADNSYYVVRSERGAQLLSQYGKTEIMIQPQAPPPPPGPIVAGYGIGYAAIAPPVPIVAGFAEYASMNTYVPVQPTVHMQAMQVTQVAQVAAPREEVRVKTTERVVQPHVELKAQEREYYRVDDEAMRHKLDMMDGVADGKLNGQEILLRGEAPPPMHDAPPPRGGRVR